MSLLVTFLFILVSHYVADWLMQSHWMAANKSSNNLALGLHVGAYSLTLLLCLFAANLYFAVASVPVIIAYVAFNGVVHAVVDYVTSRISTHYWNQKEWHNFFAVIGGDQLLHQLTLGVSLIFALTI